MHISGTEPLSVILSQTKLLKRVNKECPKIPKQVEAKKGSNPTLLQYQSIFNTDNFDALKALLINLCRP